MCEWMTAKNRLYIVHIFRKNYQLSIQHFQLLKKELRYYHKLSYKGYLTNSRSREKALTNFRILFTRIHLYHANHVYIIQHERDVLWSKSRWPLICGWKNQTTAITNKLFHRTTHAVLCWARPSSPLYSARILSVTVPHTRAHVSAWHCQW